MSRFGFCGGSYKSESINVADNTCVNWYPETVEGDGTTPVAMYPRPGLTPFTSVSASRIWGMFVSEQGGSSSRLFVVGNNFNEVLSNGTVIPYTFLPPITKPVSMAANNSGQLIICAGGQLWLFPLILAGTIVSAVSSYSTRNIATVARVGPVGPHRLYSLTLGLLSPAPATWTTGTVLTFGGLTSATYINDQSYTLQYGGGTTSLTFFPGIPATPYGPAPDTGAVFDITTRVIITLNAPVTYKVGDQISFIGVTNLAGLNGRTFTITSVSGNTFTISAPGLNINYSGPETGYSITPGQIAVPTRVNPNGGYFSKVVYLDDYFIALIDNSQKFQISGLGDGTVWNPLDVFQVSQFPENIAGIEVNHRDLWVFSNRHIVPYTNAGDPLIPFQPISGAFIETGLASPTSVVTMDNSIFWLGADSRGQGIAWRANGYTPVRVSNHAVEFEWGTYVSIFDVEAYTYQEAGHQFWVLWFPSADKTWVYDAATGQWHERTWFQNGINHAHRSCCHVAAFDFDLHYVGDRASGVIYLMSLDQVTDFIGGIDGPINYIRRAPAIANEQKWIYHQELQVYLETGLPSNAPSGDPQISLRWSKDGGHTWSSYYQLSAGLIGEYSKRVIWRRLGRARNMVYEISTTDPLSWRLVDAYLEAVPELTAQQRMKVSLSKG